MRCNGQLLRLLKENGGTGVTAGLFPWTWQHEQSAAIPAESQACAIGATAIGQARMPYAQQAGGRRHCGPEDHNRQHQQRAFSAPIHGVQVPKVYC